MSVFIYDKDTLAKFIAEKKLLINIEFKKIYIKYF